VPELSREGDVFLVDIGNDENRFHPDWIARFNEALDEIEKKARDLRLPSDLEKKLRNPLERKTAD